MINEESKYKAMWELLKGTYADKVFGEYEDSITIEEVMEHMAVMEVLVKNIAEHEEEFFISMDDIYDQVLGTPFYKSHE